MMNNDKCITTIFCLKAFDINRLYQNIFYQFELRIDFSFFIIITRL